MSSSKQGNRIRLGFKEKLGLIAPFAIKKIKEQIKAVFLIVAYLILFQTIALNIPIADAVIITAGIVLVIIGLAFFMEGLFLGLMPLGETIGVKLPQKFKLPAILAFAFILGVGATFAEPAIGILKSAGAFVKPWDAPLLFLLLNKHSAYLVNAVGVGVGIAVMFGMLRFLYGWSLKPFTYVLAGGLVVFSCWGIIEPNIQYLTGVAWDCGGVTTGPVTVPLVLALGIGICRIAGGQNTENSGFGVVTLASLFPIFAVLLLGAFFLPQTPSPMTETDFFKKENRAKATGLFENENALIGYALMNAAPENQAALFEGGEPDLIGFIGRMKQDRNLTAAVLGNSAPDALERWALERGTRPQQLVAFGDEESIRMVRADNASQPQTIDMKDVTLRNSVLSVQAIVPLVLVLLIVLLVLLRERLPRPDEIFLGVVFAVLGMILFNIGNELGLSRLGGQVGSKLPSSFKSIPLSDEKQIIRGFDESIIQTSLTPDGAKERFFVAKINDAYVQVPFEESAYERENGLYHYTPLKGPLYGGDREIDGFLVVLIFAFVMGYGATLAEPALNALGLTVEELTVGTFKKSMLMQAVAIGVGLGIAIGVVKVIWDIPLIWLLTPPYLLVLFITWCSTEEYVNIGWDSAGVTTGPITVPLVLAMGLGIGNQINVVEGFGILAMASVYPILTVLLVGLYVSRGWGRK
ncbi:MAG: DUF1538 domain-containing protein [candidate division Zixibacteria bacterium]|nr:DUF1538 domain-containing protein [candidate division Zixibacteria bacterium]